MIYFLKRGMEWNCGLGFIQATTVPFLEFFITHIESTPCVTDPFPPCFFYTVGIEVLVSCTVCNCHSNKHINYCISNLLIEIITKFALLLINKSVKLFTQDLPGNPKYRFPCLFVNRQGKSASRLRTIF